MKTLIEVMLSMLCCTTVTRRLAIKLNRLSANSAKLMTATGENMAHAFVRSVCEDEKLSLMFKLNPAGLGERVFTFNRQKAETLGTVFHRIEANVTKVMTSKLKKKKKEDKDASIPSVSCSLHVADKEVSTETLNSDAWVEGAILRVNETKFQVRLNPPTITALNLPKTVMAGYTVYPAVDLEFSTLEESKFVWYKKRLPHEKRRRRSSQSSNHSIDEGDSSKPSENTVSPATEKPADNDELPLGFGGWIKTNEGYTYDVTSDDIDRLLKVTCTPISGSERGLETTAQTANLVQPGPGRCPFEDRHLFTENLTSKNEIRCVTYNILADMYADQEYSRAFLFPQCPPYALSFDYRRQLLLKEILGYHGDILCFQEVDVKAFKKDLEPILGINGLEGIFSRKGGEVAEGVACFFRRSRFKLVHSKSSVLSEVLKDDKNFCSLLDKIKSNEKLYKRVMDRWSVFQMVLLESIDDPSRAILVGNTHLYFHPDADHVRLLQSSICFNHLEHVMNDLRETHSYTKITPIICGDFNSCPEFGVYKLATTGHVDGTSEDWKSNSEEIAEDVTVSHDLKLASACGLPQYTNYVKGFNGCLDYIFYDITSFDVQEVVPYPSHEEVTLYTALPNVVFPSDHLASIATLKWKN